MPKQRNHPHHHSANERAAREGGLQLPQMNYPVPGTPRWRYPAGWVTRPFWRGESHGIRAAGFVWAAILLIAVVIAIISR